MLLNVGVLHALQHNGTYWHTKDTEQKNIGEWKIRNKKHKTKKKRKNEKNIKREEMKLRAGMSTKKRHRKKKKKAQIAKITESQEEFRRMLASEW